jgi:cobalt-zinc-cadmium efflux system membrane fusion protein
LSDSQLASVKVEPAGEYVFPIEKEAVGSIDFNQEMSVQVFTPYQGSGAHHGGATRWSG